MTKIIIIIFTFLLTTITCKSQNPLSSLNFKSNKIYNWRIYYNRGNIIDSINPNRPVFAIQGDSSKLKKLGIDTLLNKMFETLQNVSIQKHTWTENGIKYKGKPDHVSIWWKNKGDINYYRIDVILKESPDISEEIFNYVMVSIGPFGNDQTIHYVNKKEAMTVFNIMKFIATNKWGNNYVNNP